MSLTIRRYRWSDLEAVYALHRISLARVGVVAGDGVYYDDDFPRINEIYLADRGEFLVGEVVEAGAPRLVAMGGLRRVDDHVAEMCRLRVHPDVQRRGYGERMLRALESRAVALGYRVVRGDTTLAQRAALALYAKHGWHETGRREEGGLTVIYIEKRLVPDSARPFTAPGLARTPGSGEGIHPANPA